MEVAGLKSFSGPARISRGLKPAEIVPDSEGLVPFVVSALHPCGVASIATLARTQGRRYFTPMCDVTQDVKSADTVGIFGYYGSLTLKSGAIKESSRVLMQDLLSDKAYDVSDYCKLSDGNMYIPGELINKLGTSCNHEGDTSEPGVILKIENA